MRQRVRRGDGGFTLVELSVVMTLTAIVVPTLAISLVLYFKTSFAAAHRADHAHHSKLVATTLQTDLASAKSAAAASAGCPQPSRLTLSWSQPDPLANGGAGAATTYAATYSTTADGTADGPFVLNRALSVTSPSGTTTTTEPMVRSLLDPCDVVFAQSGQQVRIAITQRSPSSDGPAETTHVYGRVGVRQ